MRTRSKAAATQVSSAIPGMSVLEVRRGMDAVRSAYHDGTLVLTDPLVGPMTAAEFCTRLCIGQHNKRRLKRARRQAGQANTATKR